MKSILFVLVASFASLSFADDMATMKTAADKFAKAWNKHDAKAMASVFAEDADVIDPMGRLAKGKTAIEAMFVEDHSKMMKDTKFELKVESMRVVDGLAFVDGTANVTGMMGPDGKKMDKMPHHVFWISKKTGNDWQVVAMRPYVFVKPPHAHDNTHASN